MEQFEAARVLLAKARQDEYVLARFEGDAGAADETFGFNAQQAVEKLLKAMLASAGVVYPRLSTNSPLGRTARSGGRPWSGGAR